MKTKTLLVIALLCVQNLFSQETYKKEVSADIESVTVFLSGAEVHRSSNNIQIKKGLTELRFTEISTYTDSRSIQFNTSADLDLLSITMETDFLNLGERSDKIQHLQDSIDFYELRVQEINDEKGAWESEKQLLVQNQKIGGENVNLSVEEIQKAADFYRARMQEINKKVSEFNRNYKKVNEKLMKLRRQLTEFNYIENVKNQVIIALVESNVDATIDAQLRYNVTQCGWAPNYDLIADDLSGKIELKYKAKVFNNTGNNWKNVGLKLSTGDPKLSASIPKLDAWYLNAASFSSTSKKSQYAVPQAQSRVNNYQSNAPGSFDFGEGRLQNAHTGDFSGATAAKVTMETIEVSELSTEFEIDKKYSIPSDAKPYIVEITDYELNGTFSHVSVPKLDKDAFLLAKITGWESLDLVPGPSNVYFSQTYVGESYINTRNVEDTLGLSFGRDGKILVTRKKSEEYSNKKVMGNWKKDFYTYEIIVKNNRSRNVQIEIKDQVPVSQDSDVSVSIENISEAEHDEATGELSWKLGLKPGESKKLIVSFELKYPKAKNISVKKYRSVSAPRFM